jgi:hypothetical protein
LPEIEKRSFSQELALEFVKSQYGAVVIGALIFPVFGITIAALLAPVLAILFPNITAGAKTALEGLNPLQLLAIIANPGTFALVFVGEEFGPEIEQKIRELNIGNLLRKALGL